MEDKAIRGVPWTLLSYGANKTVLLLSTVALARLLPPRDFGLVALATIAVTFLAMIKDLGLGGTLIVRQDLDARSRETVLGLMVAGGLVMAGAAALAAAPLAAFFDEPRLTGVLLGLTPMLVIGGFAGFYEAVLQAELEFRRRFYALMAQALTIAAVSVGAAVAGAGVWSLVAGQVVGLLVFAVMVRALARERIRPRLHRDRAREVMAVGKGFLVQSGAAFLRANADYVAVGRAFGSGPLGHYSMAWRLADMPYQAVTDPVSRVTFPAFARLRAAGQSIADPYLKVLRLMTLVCVALGAMLSAAAEPFTLAVFGEDWRPMTAPLTVLGLWAVVRAMESTTAWMLNAVGLAGISGAVSVGILVVLVPGLVLAASLGTPTTVAAVVLADALLSLTVLALVAHRRAGIRLADQWAAVFPVLAAAVPAWIAARVAASGIDASPWLALPAAVAVGLAAYLAAIRLLHPPLLRDALGHIGRTLRPQPAEALQS